MLSGFLVLVSPITDTCVNAKHMHGDWSLKKQTNIKLGGTISRGDFPNNKSPGSLCAEIFFGSTIVFTMDFAVHPIYGCLKKGWYHKKKY